MLEATNTNFIVFGLTRSGLKPTIYHTRGEHANHYTTDAVHHVIEKIPLYNIFVSVSVRSDMIDSPPTYESEHPYITVGAHFNHSFYTRTLPPVPKECPTPMGTAGRKQLPDLDALVNKLFIRETFKPEPIGTSALFTFFAQHFTHQFFKTDIKRGPQYQWGGHGVRTMYPLPSIIAIKF